MKNGITIRTRNAMTTTRLQEAAQAYGFRGERNIKALAAMLEDVHGGRAVVIKTTSLKAALDMPDLRAFLLRIIDTAAHLADTGSETK